MFGTARKGRSLENREKWAIGGILAFLGLLTLFSMLQKRAQRLALVEQMESRQPAQSQSDERIFVHVAGHVQNPGVYEMEEGARVHQAIAKAGGPLEDADLDALNLARVLQDQEKVYVPGKGEHDQIGAMLPQKRGEVEKDKININVAQEDQLDTLPGVGPATAKKIIAYREENGPFQRFEDLLAVPGIGKKKLEELKPYVTFR